MKTKESITAIPTVYNGVQLKSRMESKCAYLFDMLRWKWEYEPMSVMLNGVNYTPDFYIPERQYLIECRGYESDLGRRQINETIAALHSGFIGSLPVRSYIVIGPEDCRIYQNDYAYTGYDLMLGLCIKCDRWLCDPHHCDCEHFESEWFKLTVSHGQLALDGLKPEEWESWPLWDARGRARHEFSRIFSKVIQIFKASGWDALYNYLPEEYSPDPASKILFSVQSPWSKSETGGKMLESALKLACYEESTVRWPEPVPKAET